MDFYTIYIVSENFICAAKLRYNYGVMKLFFFQSCNSNTWFLSIGPCTVIAFALFLSFVFGISHLLFFFTLCIFIAFRTSAIEKNSDSDRCCSFFFLEAIARSFSLLLANAFKSEDYSYRNSWQKQNHMGSKIEKKP